MSELTERAHREIQALIQQSYGRGQRLPSERRLAGLLGVSQTVIHQAMQRLLSAGVIESVARRGCFVAHGGAVQGKQNQYGLYLHENVVDLLGADSFLVRVIVALRQQLRAQRCALLGIGPRRAVAGRVSIDYQSCPEEIPWNHVDGLFVLLSVEDFGTLRHPALRQGPVLVLDQDATTEGLDSVVFDDERAGAWAARHLLELSHRRFGIVEEKVTPHRACDAAWLRRRVGFEQAVLRQGGTIDPDWRLPWSVFSRNAPTSGAPWQKRLRALLDRKPSERPTAFFCPATEMMATVDQFLSTTGNPAPRSFSLIAIGSEGDHQRDSFSRSPTLLTVSPEELGQRAVEVMPEVLRLGSPGEKRPARAWLVAPKFHEGETTAECSR